MAVCHHIDLHPWVRLLVPLEPFAAPWESRFVDGALDVDGLTVHLAITTPMAACPRCGSEARNVHSRYSRRLAGLPCFGRAVQLRVTVRRFSCPQPECPRLIFAERLPGFAEPHARTTSRLRQAHESIAYALGGEAGARLSKDLAMATSPDTLLRRVKQLKGGSPPTPRLVGIDDWAWCKGRRYGTIVVDLERGDVVDLLPDREAETVKTWLNEHPGVELVSRDRWSAYAQASAEADTKPQQVADRWHLLKNLREAIERLFERQSQVIGEALRAAETPMQPACSPVVNETVEVPPTAEPSPAGPPIEPGARTSNQARPSRWNHHPRRRRANRPRSRRDCRPRG